MKPSQLFEIYGWCKGASARDKDGKPVTPFESTAQSFCAFMKCYPGEKGSFSRCISKLTSFLGGDISEYNDFHCGSKEELIEKLKRIGE